MPYKNLKQMNPNKISVGSKVSFKNSNSKRTYKVTQILSENRVILQNESNKLTARKDEIETIHRTNQRDFGF